MAKTPVLSATVRFPSYEMTISWSRHLSGCDFSRIVEEIGSAVVKLWKKGDRICGVAHGGNLVQPDDGAFSSRLPPSLSAATTVGQGLYQKGIEA
jgi:hypothetical protein